MTGGVKRTVCVLGKPSRVLEEFGFHLRDLRLPTVGVAVTAHTGV